MGKTQCPYCPRSYDWDSCQDAYRDGAGFCDTSPASSGGGPDREVELTFCRCGAVLAVQVVDEFGGQLYVPCAEEL